jgi:hypothetical protein
MWTSTHQPLSEVKCSDGRWNGAVGNLNGVKPNVRVVKCSWVKFKWEEVMCRQVQWSVVGWSIVKCSEGLSNRVSNIIWRYIDHTRFAAYVAFSFITFFHILLVPFLSLYTWLYVLHASVSFCTLCTFIVMFVYSYCYVCSVLCIVSLCRSVYCLCVNVYCTTATGCQPNCS